MSALTGFFLVLAGFGFLIFLHELGHFLAAKWAGIRADGFAIGMGPCLGSYRKGAGLCFGSADAVIVRKYGKRPIEMSDKDLDNLRIGETEYSLRALPLGGYVRMLGQEDGNPGAVSSDARSFNRAPLGKRAVVILAGITANLVLAIVLFLIAFLVGVRFPAPRIGAVQIGSPAFNATPVDPKNGVGLRAGDTVIAIDGEPARTFIDVRLSAAMAKPDTALAFEIERDGARMGYSVTPIVEPISGLLSIGVDSSRVTMLTDVRSSLDSVRTMLEVFPTLVAAGVQPGWRIDSVDAKPVSNYAQLTAAAHASKGEPLALTWSDPASNAITTVPLDLEPEFETLKPASALGAVQGAVVPGFDAGLVGLAPLARVREVVAESLNHESLHKGDVFLRIGSLEGPRVSELMKSLRSTPNAAIPALVLRDGVETAVEVRTDKEGRVGVFLEPAWDLRKMARAVERVSTGESARDTPAKSLAIIPLGEFVSLDGEPLADFRALRLRLIERATATDETTPLSLRIGLRDPSPNATVTESTMTLTAADLASLRELDYEFPIPSAYFDPEFTVLTAHGNPLEAVAMGFRQTSVMIEQFFLTLDRIGRGSIGVEQLQGPVGILHTGTQVADEGLMYIVFFLALISVNLAVVNALPIPIADGGLFAFLIYEKIVGRPPSIAFQNGAAIAGIAFVACLFLLTFYNDIGRLLS